MASHSFRPKSWKKFLGQTQIIENLKVYVESAKRQNKCLDHLLIQGSSGMGKTSLAFLISKVMKAKLHILNGPSIQKPSDLIAILSAIKVSDILFIDEIHAVSKEILEILYPVLEDNKLSLIIGKEYNSKIVNVALPQFTVIVATTEVHRLPYPLINRFPINFQILDYSPNELAQIVKNASTKIDLPLNSLTCKLVASYCRNTPRVAINLVNRIKDFWVTECINTLDEISLKYTFKLMGLYDYGLGSKDIEYLKVLQNNKSLGVETLAQLLDIPIATITYSIEPLLIKEQLIIRTLRGRVIIDKGIS